MGKLTLALRHNSLTSQHGEPRHQVGREGHDFRRHRNIESLGGDPAGVIESLAEVRPEVTPAEVHEGAELYLSLWVEFGDGGAEGREVRAGVSQRQSQ